MANPYSVLGVSKDADEKEIKSAFRKMAKKYHPDQNAGNDAAHSKFAEVNQAYEILGDKEKRRQFDNGEIDETGKEKFSGFAGGDPFGQFRQAQQGRGGQPFGDAGFGGAEDILGEIFGSAFGGQRKAGGFGGGDPFSGMNAGGRPKAVSLDVELKAAVTIEDLMRGKAAVRMPDGKQISVSIPPEAHDRQVIRLKGQGKKAAGRRPGDALITLVMSRHPRFERSGADLRCQVSVPLEVAVLGGKAAVETVDGKLSLNIPSGTSSGKTFRLKGKGLPKKGGGFGDLLASTMIELPQDRIEDLKDFFSGK